MCLELLGSGNRSDYVTIELPKKSGLLINFRLSCIWPGMFLLLHIVSEIVVFEKCFNDLQESFDFRFEH